MSGSHKRRLALVLAVGLAAAMLAGCQVSKVAVSDYQAQAVAEGQTSVPVALSKVVIRIPRGKTVGEMGYGAICRQEHELRWNTGGVGATDDELVDLFYQELKQWNYDVVGSPRDLFNESRDRARAQFMIGAQITDLLIEACDPDSIFVDATASLKMKVEWQIYDIFEKQTILTVRTEGAANTKFKKMSQFDSYELIQLAFVNALHGLMADEVFYKLMMQGNQSVSSTYTSPDFDPARYRYSCAAAGEARSLESARKSVVTVRVGMGSGTGFVLTGNGLVITNEHVVGNSDKVKIETLDGKVFDGRVVAKNARRDIAALVVPGLRLEPLKVRKGQLRVGEDIYAIGSPGSVTRELQTGTVTKGIVSSYRNIKQENWIQGDAAINPGNSGGPVLDERGNVVGISTLGDSRDGIQGLFYYGPIEDGLNRLNLRAR